MKPRMMMILLLTGTICTTAVLSQEKYDHQCHVTYSVSEDSVYSPFDTTSTYDYNIKTCDEQAPRNPMPIDNNDTGERIGFITHEIVKIPISNSSHTQRCGMIFALNPHEIREQMNIQCNNDDDDTPHSCLQVLSCDSQVAVPKIYVHIDELNSR